MLTYSGEFQTRFSRYVAELHDVSLERILEFIEKLGIKRVHLWHMLHVRRDWNALTLLERIAAGIRKPSHAVPRRADMNAS